MLTSCRYQIALTLTIAAALAACSDATGPKFGRPPYIAIIAKINATLASELGAPYSYHVRELSGQLHIDTVVTVSPTDTVILAVPAATYVVSVSGVPPQCRLRDGADQAIVVPPHSNTSVIRYVVDCRSLLTVVALTDGADVDSTYVYRLTTADGAQKVGLLRANDTLGLDHLPTGPTTFELANLSANCDIVSNGGARRAFVLDSIGGAILGFRIICSDSVHRPTLTDFQPSYHDGAAGVLFDVSDPDRDADYYIWDLTDCHRMSVLPNGPVTRQGIFAGVRTRGDTTTVIAALEVRLPVDSLIWKCAALWVGDRRGNLSAVSEAPLAPRRGHPPAAVQFNAKFLGVQAIRTQVTPTDPDGDFLGVFAAARMVDGALGPPDGVTDIGAFNAEGYPGAQVPDLILSGGLLSYQNFYGVIVYLFDSQGNFTRLEDGDLFQ